MPGKKKSSSSDKKSEKKTKGLGSSGDKKKKPRKKKAAPSAWAHYSAGWEAIRAIDAEQLMDACDNDAEFAAELQDLFVSNNASQAPAKLRAALAERALGQMVFVSHDTKGAAASVGLLRVSAIAKDLEAASRRVCAEVVAPDSGGGTPCSAGKGSGELHFVDQNALRSVVVPDLDANRVDELAFLVDALIEELPKSCDQLEKRIKEIAG